MSKKQTSYNFNFDELILFLYRNWKKLAIVTILAGILAAIFSGPTFIKPKYRSVATFYPGTVNSISSALFYSIKQTAQDPLAFAEQEVTEQYLQLLQSSDLKWKVVGKFKLMEHYGLDPAEKSSYKKLDEFYDKNIKVSRTDFNSVKIDVLDHDPEAAAKIANGIMFTVDEMRHDIQKRIATQISDIVKAEYFAKLRRVDSIETRLKELGNEGVYDVFNQAKAISEINGKGQNNAYSKKEEEKLGAHGGEVTFLNQMLELEAENLTLLHTKFEQARIDEEGKLSNIFVVSYAGPSDDKASPVRSIVVLIASVSAFLFGCFVILALEKARQLRLLIQEET